MEERKIMTDYENEGEKLLQKHDKEKQREWEEQWYKDHPKFAPHDNLGISGKNEKKWSNGDSDLSTWYESYTKRKHIVKGKYENVVMFENSDSDAGCSMDLSDWTPSEYFSSTIFGGLYAISDLTKLCVKNISLPSGNGDKVKVKVVGKFAGIQEPLEPCECMSCASITFSSYEVTIHRAGMDAILCSMTEWETTNYREQVLDAMRKTWAQSLDATIYSELSTSGAEEMDISPLSCTPFISGSCCSDSSLINLYNGLNSAIIDLRENNYDPDYIILSPSVGAILRRLQSPTSVFGNGIVQFDSDARLSKFMGVSVIEYNGATKCTSSSGAKIAIVLDSKYAVTVVFGQPPKFEFERSASCDSTQIVWNSYYGVSELDVDSIRIISNA